MKKKRQPMTYGEYCTLLSHGVIKNHKEIIEAAEKPWKLCGRFMPDSLDMMRMGTLVEVMSGKDDVMKAMTSIYNVTRGELSEERADVVIGAMKWTESQMSRIADLFSRLERELTADEIMAGAEQMKGDIFNTIDWYALRMGISNHDEVLRVPWVTIWRCAKDDRDRDEYKLRLHNIQNQKR